MKDKFLSLAPQERLRILRSLLVNFKNAAIRINAPFIILVYGSASYGFNQKHQSKLEDIDLFLVISRQFSARETLSFAERVFGSTFDISPAHLQRLLDGDWEMCRMYGRRKGVRLSFRIVCQDTVDRLFASEKNMTADICNVAVVGSSRIVTDVEWSIKEWKYVPITLKNSVVRDGVQSLIAVKHHLFSRRFHRLGALGRKLMTSQVVHDPSKLIDLQLLLLWQKFVMKALHYHPSLSDKSMVNAVMRSEKFSVEFRENLVRIIREIRSKMKKPSL